MQQVKLRSWSDFEGEIQKVSLVRQDLEQGSHQRLPALLFRGLGSSEWGWDKLPTIPEFEALMDRATATGLLDTILSPLTEVYEYLAYLRHHGFPSPLLDWTASPYVAAFFAFDAPPRRAQDVCVFVLLQGPFPAASHKADLFVVGPYMRSHPRHFLQQCWYSMCIALVNKVMNDAGINSQRRRGVDSQSVRHGPAPRGQVAKDEVILAGTLRSTGGKTTGATSRRGLSTLRLCR